MFSNFLKVISLKNLYGSSEKGQITTLLLLMIVGVLAFVLVTANLGNVSTVTTNLSNAADSAALYLASQLATRSNQLWEELDRDTEKCKKGGMLSLILAIVIAIIAVVVCFFIMGPAGVGLMAFLADNLMAVMIAGAIGGAIGGTAGAAIQGTSILTGALMGAVVGAAVGACASAIGSAVVAAEAAAAPTTLVSTVTVNSGVPVVSQVMAPTAIVGNSAAIGAMKTAIGAATLSAIGVGAKVYNEYVTQEMTFDAIRAGIKSINGLLEYDRYRETVFYQALSETIDDPNKTDSDYVRLWYDDDGDGELGEGENRHCRSDGGGNCDPWDSDGDGDKKEAVPYFQYWWDIRVRALKSAIPELQALTYLFLWGEHSEAKTGDDGIKTGYDTAKYRSEPYNPSLSKLQESTDYEHSFQDYAVNQYSETYACILGSTYTSSDPLCPASYSFDGSGYGYSSLWSSGLLYRSGVGTSTTEWKRYIKCPSEYSDYYSEGTSCKTNLTINSSETDKILVPLTDGVIVQVGKALEDKGIEVSFYEPGLTTRNDYDGDDKDGEEKCSKKKDKDGKVVKDKNGKAVYECDGEEYHDEAEVVVATLIDFKEAVKALKPQSIDRLTSTWQTWIRTFYDMGVKERDEETCKVSYKKESQGNFYDQFDIIIDGEDLDGDKETGEENVDVPIDSDGDGITDSYEVKDEFKGLRAWKKEIKEAKNKLKKKISACEAGYSYDLTGCNDYCYGRYGDGSGCSVCYKNAPCLLEDGGITTDNDSSDEFEEALTAIDGLISNLESFKKSAKAYYDEMAAVYEEMNDKYGADYDFGGINPVTYRWSDSRCMGGKDFEEDKDGNPDVEKICGQDTSDSDKDGDTSEIDPTCPQMDVCDQEADGITEELYRCHSITVEVSQFKVPWIDNQESGGFLSKKSCAVLTDYCYKPNADDTSWECKESYNPLWVKITRSDLGNQMVGSIAKWNPKGDGADEETCSKTSNQDISEECKVWKKANPEFKISRSATPYFSYNKVGLARAGKKKAE